MKKIAVRLTALTKVKGTEQNPGHAKDENGTNAQAAEKQIHYGTDDKNSQQIGGLHAADLKLCIQITVNR